MEKKQIVVPAIAGALGVFGGAILVALGSKVLNAGSEYLSTTGVPKGVVLPFFQIAIENNAAQCPNGWV
ncbi:MAG: hypothetical protein AAFY29_21080 [Pseudomonadota bacterium]